MISLLKSLKKKQGLRSYVGPKRIIMLCVLTIIVIWAWGYYKSGILSPSIIEAYRIQYPIYSLFLFILIYAIIVIAAIPSLPLNLAAGYFWGGLMGGVFTTIGVTLGGWISFQSARWLIGQPFTDHYENKWASRVQEEFDRNGWKFVAFARINPIIPTGPLNYLLGLTSLSNLGFLWVTFVFLLPPSIAVAYIGDTLQTFTENQADVIQIVRGILISSAAVTFMALAIFISNIYKNRSEKNENNTLGNDTQ